MVFTSAKNEQNQVVHHSSWATWLTLKYENVEKSIITSVIKESIITSVIKESIITSVIKESIITTVIKELIIPPSTTPEIVTSGFYVGERIL